MSDFFFCKQKTAYELRISDWSSDVCSSDLNDLNVIDRFMQAFITYIDAGFGLLGGDVRFLTVTLIGIDITLAGLFWALGGDDNVMGRFIKKILYVGAFAFILNSFSTLSDKIGRAHV